jgi:HEAT repeat protein
VTWETPIPATRDEALRALGTKDAEVRRLVVRALERAPADAAREVLPVILGDEDWRVRKEGIQLAHALAERADVVPILVEILRSPSDQVSLRNAAVEALAGLGALAAPAVEAALRAGTLDADGRKLAVDVLAGARQPRSAAALVASLDDEDPNVRAAAAEALGIVGGEVAATALLSVLDARAPGGAEPEGRGDRDQRFLRLVALEGLNRLGTVIPYERLSGFLGDKVLRHAAVAALGRIGEARAVVALVGALEDPSRHVGETALRALGDRLRIDPLLAADAREHAMRLGATARGRVLGAADRGDPQLRRAALPILALLADPSAGAETEALVRALRDPDVADDAEAALDSLGDAVLPTLLEVARRGDASSRAAVLSLLPKLARARAVAIDLVRDALRDPDPEVVAAAAAAFAAALAGGELPNAADVHALLRVAAGRDAARGSAAAKAAAIALQSLRTLARVRADDVRPHLSHVDVTDDEAPVVCALLAVAGGPEHVPWLSRAATAPSPRTRRAAVEALGQIGGSGAAVALGYAITDEVPEVALAAIKALGRVRDEAGQGIGAGPLLRLVPTVATTSVAPSSNPVPGGDEAIVAAAVRALGATRDPRAAEVLRPLTSSASVAVACAALEAMADLQADDLHSVVLRALAHPSNVVARTALDVLDAALPAEGEGVPVDLAVAIAHPSWEVRRRAIELATRLDPLAVRPLLVARAAIEGEQAVKDALDRALLEVDRRASRTTLRPREGARGRLEPE